MPRARLPALLALVLPLAAGALDVDSLPLSEDERLQRFAQRHLYSDERCEPGAHEVPEVGPKGVRVEQVGRLLVLTGSDRAGRPFRVRLGVGAESCALYRADLDKDGTEDLLVLSSGVKGGRSRLTVVLFDAAGRPVPWAAEGPFVGDEHGVEDVLDLDGDGQAEVVRQEAGARYALASLYEARGARVHRVQGAHGGRRWPLVARGRRPFEADLDNVEEGRSARLVGLELPGAKKGATGAPRLKLDDGRTCEPVGAHGTFTVVVDTPEGREVAQHSAPEATRELLEAVRRQGLPVKLTGQRQRGRCSPEALFATDAPAP